MFMFHFFADLRGQESILLLQVKIFSEENFLHVFVVTLDAFLLCLQYFAACVAG